METDCEEKMTNSEDAVYEGEDTKVANPTWVLGLLGFSILSFVLGLFILPQKVEVVRFVAFDGERDVVWEHINTIEDWDKWDAWGHVSQNPVSQNHIDQNIDQNIDPKNASEQEAIRSRMFATGEYQGNLSFVKIDSEEYRVYYKLDEHNAEGDLFVERTPDGVRVFWHHSYMCGFSPFSRMTHWLTRGKLALELDQGLQNLQKISSIQ